MRLLILAALLSLAACGADGPPERPAARDAVPTVGGVTITGEARIGVSTDL